MIGNSHSGIGSALGVTAALLLALTAACSGSDSPQGGFAQANIEEPTKKDGGAKPPTRTDRDGGKDEADPAPPAACPSVFPESATCQTCFAKSCKTECGSCGADEECATALACIGKCSSGDCVSGCVAGVPDETRDLLLDILGDDGCVLAKCNDECGGGSSEPVANKKTGDACESSSECLSGACNDWCIDTCTHNTDCGFSSSGNLVWCVASSSGSDMCFPGCKSNGDCSAFPGATCQTATATNGASTKVCAF